MIKPTCPKCKRNFKVVCRNGLCCYCYKKETGEWSLEFSNYKKDKNGNLISNEGPMKFRK